MNGEDCISEDQTKWKLVPSHLGRVSSLSKFHNIFFGINAIQAQIIPPEVRMATEVTLEAVIDAGMNPVELKNK
ncbi:hypothetical protein M0804_014434 [Polistes exclamans]|nr:hypothetical protein M0804_014434 [Polistes exclamans]